MPNKPTTFFDELVLAAQGCLALLAGNRQAATYFDFSRRGLVGSWIAVLLAVALAAFGGSLLGIPAVPGLPTQVAIINLVGCGLQAGIAYLLLRQMGRLDGFVPYLVAANWVALVTSVSVFLASVLGDLGLVLLIGVLVASFVIMVNTGRLIVTLTPVQLVIFFVAQVIGVLVGVALIGGMVIDPATLAQ